MEECTACRDARERIFDAGEGTGPWPPSVADAQKVLLGCPRISCQSPNERVLRGSGHVGPFPWEIPTSTVPGYDLSGI